MRCMNCGADIPEGMLICPDCGMEVQIVPDYNPLDDVLARQVKGSVAGATRPLRTDDIRRYRGRNEQQSSKSTRVLSQSEMDQIRAERMRRVRQDAMHNEKERQRQVMLRKKRALKRRLQAIATFFVLLLLVFGVCAFLIYQNSYDGVIRHANQALGSGSLSEAEVGFQRAIQKDAGRPEGYAGLSKVYIEREDLEAAEAVFIKAVNSQPLNVALYNAAIEFYMETGQTDKIPGLLEGCEQGVLEELEAYQSDAPAFSLAEGTYSEVQEVTLTGKGTIHYTLDGSEPTADSQEFTEPLLLEEGTVVIKAICINALGIPSLCVSRTYTVEIPVEDAPAVTPSTGQYTTPTQITIQVPEGYTAYYTMDNTEPTAFSTRYEGPIDMPEGRTFFAAVLVSDSGKTTPVTKRNYVLTYE